MYCFISSVSHLLLCCFIAEFYLVDRFTNSGLRHVMLGTVRRMMCPKTSRYRSWNVAEYVIRSWSPQPLVYARSYQWQCLCNPSQVWDVSNADPRHWKVLDFLIQHQSDVTDLVWFQQSLCSSSFDRTIGVWQPPVGGRKWVIETRWSWKTSFRK